MDEKVIIEFVNKLIGDYEAVGETNHDDYSNQRLKVLAEVTYHYVRELSRLTQYRNAVEYSVKECGTIADKFFEWIDDYAKDWEEENV